MIPGLKIEFLPSCKEPDGEYTILDVNDKCKCYWLIGVDQVIVIPNDPIAAAGDIKNYAILISFNFLKSIDPDGGHEWLKKKLKLLIKSLIKNRKYLLD
jgi:hypothetical protein